jgi:hypothetical protein
MIKIAFALAAAGAVLMTAPLLVDTVPAKAASPWVHGKTAGR